MSFFGSCHGGPAAPPRGSRLSPICSSSASARRAPLPRAPLRQAAFRAPRTCRHTALLNRCAMSRVSSRCGQPGPRPPARSPPDTAEYWPPSAPDTAAAHRRRFRLRRLSLNCVIRCSQPPDRRHAQVSIHASSVWPGRRLHDNEQNLRDRSPPPIQRPRSPHLPPQLLGVS